MTYFDALMIDVLIVGIYLIGMFVYDIRQKSR